MATPSDLDAPGDFLARGKRVPHALGSHADSIAPRREAPRLRHRPSSFQHVDSAIDERLDAGIAGRHRRVSVRHANNRFAKICGGKADRIEHRTVSSPCIAVGDNAGTSVEGHVVLLRFSGSISPQYYRSNLTA